MLQQEKTLDELSNVDVWSSKMLPSDELAVATYIISSPLLRVGV